MHPSKFGVSQSVTRKEDDALIRGRGRYVADVAPAGPPGVAHVAPSDLEVPAQLSGRRLRSRLLFGLGLVFGLPEAPGSPSSLTADYDNLNLAISAPEPSTLLLATLGLLGLFAVSRKRWAARVTA